MYSETFFKKKDESGLWYSIVLKHVENKTADELEGQEFGLPAMDDMLEVFVTA